MVRAIFDGVAERYDLMNDLMSAGIHRLWKAALIDWLNPRPPMHLLDVAGGTGDVARGFLKRCRGPEAGARVTVLDISAGMLTIGRDRALDRALVRGIDWICGDAEALPIADAAADAVTIAFGIRNVTDLAQTLAEARRVLKPGGRFLCLEFSRVHAPGLQRIYEAYSFRLLPALGELVAGDREAYRYLVESIRRFPDQETFAQMISDSGLGQVKYRNLSGGIAALHSAWRI